MEIMLNYPELKYNPFGDRICQVFSSTNNGDCTFDDFVDMLSVFSERAPLSFKAEYAFRIFDFDNDDMLGPEDLQELIRRILGDDELEQREITLLIQGVLCEADLDDDGMLSFAEFELILSKAIDFKE
jgi:calcium and integrin-binding protein 1